MPHSGLRQPIGSGWQYTVYDLGGGRVQKVPHGLVSQFLRIHDTYNDQVKHPWWETIKEIYEQRRNARQSRRGLRPQLDDPIPSQLVGNPKYLNPRGYTQDQAEVLYYYLQRKPSAVRQSVIRDYIQHVYTTWSYGFADMTFEFLLNCGINDRDNVILIDVGELAFEKQEVAQTIQNMSWQERWSYGELSEFELRSFFEKEMRESITESALEEHWQRALD